MPESGRDGQTGMQDERYGMICSRKSAGARATTEGMRL